MFRKIWLSLKTIKNLHTLVFDMLGFIKGDVNYFLWNGLTFTARAGTSDISEIIINNADSEYPSKFLPKGQKPTIIDAGANIGDTTLFIFQKLKSKNPVIYALEPNSINFKYLKKNTNQNKTRGIHLQKVALTGRDGYESLVFDSSGYDGGYISGVMKKSKNKSEKVKCLKLTTFCKANKINTVDLLKMDIEGSEYNVFRSSRQFIKNNVKTIFVELHNLNKINNYRSFKKNISRLGFDIQADIMERTLFLTNKQFYK